ncbi:MAG: hypothetical protein AMJ46_09895 [Latescibacteria bacterium DG_63]|nr:MAG: hypothetical protein AMJ46_09895 [Latescibacteria bacterium DG_63]
MKTAGVKRKLLFASVFLLAFVALFYFVYRPWQLNWGATSGEVIRPMPGDEIVKTPTFNATRAVTVNAPPERIWPWIVQIGYGRAGFYSWDILDNDGIASAERIMPEYQDLRVGDLVPLDRISNARVTMMEPPRQLVLVFPPATEATWAWDLYPIDSTRTRLVSRLRVRADHLTTRLMLDTFEIVMMRKHLLGIKRRAECLQDRP